MDRRDAVVIGSGPNGLAAAIILAQAGLAVQVREAAGIPGGGVRSEELTLSGFTHDVCSAVYPLAASSPFFNSLPLAEHGLDWIYPPAALAHPLDDGTAVLLERQLDRTSESLGRDAFAYMRLMKPLVDDWEKLAPEVLSPIHLPRHPVEFARFGLRGIRSASGFCDRFFKHQRARALFAGLAAHSSLRLDQMPSAAFGLVLAIAAHAVGWPIQRGGSQMITSSLISYLSLLGGRVALNSRVRNVDEIQSARVIMCDVTPRELVRIAGHRFPTGYRRKLERYRYGMGVFKVDFALEGPIPWKAPECLRAATVHLGGTLSEIHASELAAATGKISGRPFVILVQPGLFDATRAPDGKQTVWAYCHVPNGSRVNMLPAIESQIERFAPGFKDRVLARSCLSPRDLENRNANLVGGDIAGGVSDLRQLFVRPTLRSYSTPADGLFICSSSTPPGGGVHGMCGYHAAGTALASLR